MSGFMPLMCRRRRRIKRYIWIDDGGSRLMNLKLRKMGRISVVHFGFNTQINTGSFFC